MAQAIDLGISTEDFYLFGEGIATQSIRVSESTEAPKYRVTRDALEEIVGNLRNEPIKISVEMILYDLIDYREQKVLTTGLDQLGQLEDNRSKNAIWKLYTELENETMRKYDLEYTPVAKSSFSIFDNLLIESANYSIDNTYKTSAFRVSLEFIEARSETQAGIEGAKWISIDTRASGIQHQEETPSKPEEKTKEEEQFKNACDALGSFVSDIFSGAVDVGKQGVDAGKSFIDWWLEETEKFVCGETKFGPATFGITAEEKKETTEKTYEKLSHD